MLWNINCPNTGISVIATFATFKEDERKGDNLNTFCKLQFQLLWYKVIQHLFHFHFLNRLYHRGHGGVLEKHPGRGQQSTAGQTHIYTPLTCRADLCLHGIFFHNVTAVLILWSSPFTAPKTQQFWPLTFYNQHLTHSPANNNKLWECFLNVPFCLCERYAGQFS